MNPQTAPPRDVPRPTPSRTLSPEDRALIARVIRDGDWLLQRLARR